MDRDPQKDLELCEKATPGPWSVGRSGEPRTFVINSRRYWAELATVYGNDDDPDLHRQGKANARLIAAAREALPYWIRRAEELRERYNTVSLELEALREQSGLKLAQELENELGTADVAEAVRKVREISA